MMTMDTARLNAAAPQLLATLRNAHRALLVEAECFRDSVTGPDGSIAPEDAEMADEADALVAECAGAIAAAE